MNIANAAHAHNPNQSVWRAMFTDPHSKAFARWVAVINFWIFISCLTLALETVEPYATEHADWFRAVELLAVAFFTVDYLSNLFLAANRIKYFFSFWGLVDLISIIPTYLMILNLTALQGGKVLRLMRVVRVLRVLKMAKMAVQNIADSVVSSNPIVTNLRIYFIALFSVMMISSTLMFYMEGTLYSPEHMAHGQAALDAQLLITPLPKDALPTDAKFSPVDPISGNAIPEDKRCFTTGYGDMYPVTFWGRVIGGATMLLGLVLFGILMNIVGKTIMVTLFGEHLDDKAGQAEHEPSRDNVVRMLAQLQLINESQATELKALGAEEFKARVQRATGG